MTGQSCTIYARTHSNHARYSSRSTLHFAVAGSTVYRSKTWEETWQGETLEHTEQYHIKFVEKNRTIYNEVDVKRSSSRYFLRYNLHPRVTI